VPLFLAILLALTARTAPTPQDAPVPDDFGPTRDAFTERLNAGRTERKQVAFRQSRLLNRVAQQRADSIAKAGAAHPEESAPQDSASASKLGYEARFLSEVVVQAEGDVDMVMEASNDDPALASEAGKAGFRDLGVGVARLDEIPVYVFVFAVSWADYFVDKTVELSNLEEVRAKLLARVNEEREKAGLLPVRPDPMLDETARRHAQDMLARSYYGHDSPEGTTALERSKAAGYKPRFIGENIARGQYSTDEVMDGWMGSEVHREHILGKLLTDVGAAVAIGKNKNGYQVLWVQVFGRPKDLIPSPKPPRRRG
jgi:uncharacterized protein YkwD